jgi:transposase InsO family protein
MPGHSTATIRHRLQHEPIRQCLDNAAMESFFSSLKTERTERKADRTRNEARADVFDYIERFYNRASEHPSVYVVEEKRLC